MDNSLSVSKVPLIVHSYYGIAANNTFFNTRGDQGAGVLFTVPFGIEQIEFTVTGSNDGWFQYGFGNANAVLPNIYATGENRISFDNTFGDGKRVISVPQSIATLFYIAANEGVEFAVHSIYGIIDLT